MLQATLMAGTSTATKRCCIASVAGSCSTRTEATSISAQETGWCCRRTYLTRQPSAPKVCAASKRLAKANIAEASAQRHVGMAGEIWRGGCQRSAAGHEGSRREATPP